MTSNHNRAWTRLRRTAAIALLCFAATVFVPASQVPAGDGAPVLRIGTLDLRPYGWVEADGSRHGIVYRMLQAIGERSGLRFTNEIIPFARMLAMLEDGRLDMVISQPHKAALQAGDPLIRTNSINVIAATGKNTGIRSFEDLRNKRFLYMLAASYPPLEGYPAEIFRVKSYEHMLRMLRDRTTVDAGVFSEPAYYYWIKMLGFSPADFGQVVLVQTRDDWAFVRKDLPGETRDRLKQAIRSLQEERLYEKLMQELRNEAGF